ncbi:MAG: extracellular solute-binding protein [Candidatus Latescibacteria bacterium]|nr:extracellular solute-binding protein [Candidatus Latescibacterota bacterium]
MFSLKSLLLVLAALCFAGCGGSDTAPDGRTQVKIMGWGNTTSMAKYEILEKAFETANPDIDMKVEILDGETYRRKLPVMIASGTAPDIFECVPEVSTSFPSFASKDAYVDLQPLVERDGVDLTQWFASVIKSCRYQGKLYVLPKKLNNPACVHYNMDLFDAAGLSYPSRDWTWEEARAMARQLTRDLDGDGRIDQWGLAWPLAQGYQAPMMRGWNWTRNNGTEVNIDDPLFYQSMQWMADLIHVDRVAPTLEETEGAGLPGYQLFSTGRVAMQSGGRWQTAHYKREIGNAFRWDTVWMPIPEKGAPRRYQIGSEAWGIYRGSPVVEQAWKVLKWISGPAGSRVLGQIGGAVPAVKSVAMSADFLDSNPPSRPANQMWLEAIDYAVWPPLEPRWARIEKMMEQTFLLGWSGERPFRELAFELKPKLDHLLQAP